MNFLLYLEGWNLLLDQFFCLFVFLLCVQIIFQFLCDLMNKEFITHIQEMLPIVQDIQEMLPTIQ
jgi:hypothetical protein